jgi:hypothetical protein
MTERTDGFTDGVPESIPPVDPGYGDESLTQEQREGGDGIVSPGSTATGAGEAELGPTDDD